MDFVVRVFLDKCTNIGSRFFQLKYRIPALATHSKRTTDNWVGHADDLVLLFKDITNLKLTLVLSTTFKRYHAEINISKTKTMIFNHKYINEEYPETTVSINNPAIRTPSSSKYLEFNIKYYKLSTGDSELQKRNASFMCLRKKWRTSKSCCLHG